jgi:general secretion pathway protein H
MMTSLPVVTILPDKARSGFTLVELVVAISIVGMLLAASVPASVRFYESMQYRQAIREVITTLASARFKAVNSGKTQDVVLNPETNVMRLNNYTQQLPSKFRIVMQSARELNRDDEGVIRFYPEGGSSGGDIEIARPNGSGVKISVDWLVGRVTQKKYVFN